MSNRLILNDTAYFGAGTLKKLSSELKERAFTRVLVVTDSVVAQSKTILKIAKLLAQSRIVYQIYDRPGINLTVQNVKSGLDTAAIFKAECIIAIGGKSAINAAKAISLMYSNPEIKDVKKLEGEVSCKNKALPVIALPVASSCGAEASYTFTISDDSNNKSLYCMAPLSIPSTVIVDYELSQKDLDLDFASIGMETLCYAIESYLNKNSFKLTNVYSLEAIKAVVENIKEAVKGDKEAVEKVMNANYMASLASSNSGLGLASAMAEALSANYDIPFGSSCGLLLPGVLQFYAVSSGDKYKEIALALGAKVSSKASSSDYRKSCIGAVEKIAKELKLPKKLSDLGVQKKDLDVLSDNAVENLCTKDSLKDASKKKITDLYKAVL